jgi:hypothetical protein
MQALSLTTEAVLANDASIVSELVRQRVESGRDFFRDF